MEIKVQCDCGQKFKFDVEPVNGRMPFVVNCPICGADGTAKANALLQQLLPPPPVAQAAPVAAAPAPMRPGGLRLNRSEPETQAHEPASDDDSLAAEEAEDESGKGGLREFKLGWKVWLIVLFFVCWGLVSSFDKWSRRVSFVKDIVQFVSGLVSGGSESETAGAAGQWTLPDDDGTMVLIKHTNEMVVAQTCADFWTEKFGQKLVLNQQTNVDELDDGSLYLVQPMHNGCVEVDGPMSWDEKQAAILMAMSEYVSRKLQTTAVCALMGDDAETGTFTIYENGDRKFHCDRDYRIKDGNLEEKVQVDGETWATELGFKPGEEGFKGFTMEDANNLTEHLGLKLADRPTPTSCILLRTTGTKP